MGRFFPEGEYSLVAKRFLTNPRIPEGKCPKHNKKTPSSIYIKTH